jgi:small-conductance mechanosensitive channel
MEFVRHYLSYLPYPIAILGTIAVIVGGSVIYYVGARYIDARYKDPRDHYRKRSYLSTSIAVVGLAAIIILWARLFEHRGTFFGLMGAGIAVALREPLLSVVSRVAIFAGHLFTVGDRIEVEKMTGDVIDVGFFYTRMMEIGNWIGGDQVTGRIVQFSNSQVFGKPVFNYTAHFSYIWDEVGIPITYTSNFKAATQILSEVGGEYTHDFLQGAEKEMREMQRYFLVPTIELRPQVYIKVTDNWIQLTMRYVVDPKKRRAAASFIYSHVFERIQERDDITIASSTMDVTVRQPQKSAEQAQPELAAPKQNEDEPKAA